MALFKFEIVQTFEGLPDPSAYSELVAHTPHLKGSAKIVYEEFENEEIAKRQAVFHEDGEKSAVWEKHCPEISKQDNKSGLDVFYIGPMSQEEMDVALNSIKKVLFHHRRVTPAIFHMICGDIFDFWSGKVVDEFKEPSEWDLVMFSDVADELVNHYFECLDAASIKVTGESICDN